MNTDYFRERGVKVERKLEEMGLYSPIDYPSPVMEDHRITTAQSFPIKAFEKFLGYFDYQQNIAFNPSLSFNTDFSLTLSSCMYIDRPKADKVILDGTESEGYSKKANRALGIFKSNHNISGSFVFYVERIKNYGNAKGMSESSAVAAAVSKSLVENVFREGEFFDQIASRYARLVSGSGTRAVVDGISMWLSYPGINPEQSFAFKVKNSPAKFFYGIFPKYSAIKTDNAHSTITRSVFYETWIRNKYDSIEKMLEDDFSIEGLMRRGQEDSLNMHGVLMSVGLSPQTPESISTIRKLLEFQKNNDGMLLNADTGPSIMISSMDRSLIRECADYVGEQFIEGGSSSQRLLGMKPEFGKRSREFFSEYKIGT